MKDFSYDPGLIRQHLDGSEILEHGIDYYLCEDPNRTREEATELACAYVDRYCKRWCSRDRKDPATRHQRAFESFGKMVDEKQYFYSKRRREQDASDAQAEKQAQYEAEQEKLWENERKRIAALREKCAAKGLDFEKENKKQLKWRYFAQRIGIAIEACCCGILAISIASCGYGDGGWESVLLSLGTFLLALIVFILFCRPAKRLPDKVFEAIGKFKKEKK